VNYHSYTPVYKKLTNFYRDKIIRQEYPPESKIDSITRIMNRHHVSRETAKLILKNLVEEGLVVSVVGKGTFVAPQNTLKKEWGVVIPIYTSNMEMLINNLSVEAEKSGRKINHYIDYNNPDEEINIVGTLLNEGLEAIIIVPNFNESLTAKFYKNLNQWKTKVILVDHTMAGSHFNYVVQSYDLGVKRAMDYFRTNTRKNLLFVKNEAWRGKNLIFDLIEETMEGFVMKDSDFDRLFTISRINDISLNYLVENKIEGILTSTDIDSLRITGRLKKWGVKMPDEISVISYGNTELTEFFDPPITAIECHYDKMVSKVSELISNPKNINERVQYVIEPELIIRET